MITIDPFNENVAITDDNELVSSFRMLPVRPDGTPPTAQELNDAPIVGYGELKPTPPLD